MASLVFGLVLLIVAAIVLIVTRAARRSGRSKSTVIDMGQGRQVTMGSSVVGRVGLLGALAVGGVGGFVLLSSFVRVVPANTVGIPTTFGKVGTPMNAGLHITAPWTIVTEFSTRTQELSMLRTPDEGDKTKDDSVTVIASGGGSMAVDVTVRFALTQDQAAELFKQAGTLQLVKDRFVRPDAREVVRNVFGLYTAEEGYSTKRAELATRISCLWEWQASALPTFPASRATSASKAPTPL